MAADILILSAAGMLVTAYLMWARRRCSTSGSSPCSRCFSPPCCDDRHRRARELFVMAGLTLVLKAILIPGS